MAGMVIFIEVAVGLPIFKTFHYQVPEKLVNSIDVGKRVLVPFGGRKITGYVLTVLGESVWKDTKEIIDILDDIPLFSPEMVPFFQWVANYYLAPLGEVLKTALPGGINIGTRLRIILTEKGKEYLKSLTTGDPQWKILTRIEKGEIRSRSRFLKDHRHESPYHLLNFWQKEEIVKLVHQLNKVQTRPKKIRFAHYLDGVKKEEEKLSSKQGEILSFIKKKNKISLPHLRKEFGEISSPVRRLEERGFIALKEEEVYRSPVELECFEDKKDHELTRDQKYSLSRIMEGIVSATYSPYLLYGVTGSGKTEVYLRAIKAARDRKKGAIVLVPEIALTPQLVERFRSHFGDTIGLLHSGISPGERYDQWRRIKRGEAKIVIGARSAVFAPVDDLGIIIVDEEHDSSYKQDDRLKYHARDIALVRAKLSGAVVVLGSATPSVESFDNTEKGKLTRLHLPLRVEGRPMPRVRIVDMKKEPKKKGEYLILSRVLIDAIRANLEEKNQVMLFLNRRGFATFLICPDCGFTFRCPNCSVTLTHHLHTRKLRCHYCDYAIPVSSICPACQGLQVNFFGMGTERLEEEVKMLFPGVKVGRMDRDTTTKRMSHQKILTSLRKGDIDLLVGTQMIVKGHDFPGVTLVGVISADLSLNLPDFRASERTFQLLAQVAGRTGRGDRLGEVIIQTFNPDYFSIASAKNHDYPGFFQKERALRKEFGYPPFSYLVNLRLSGKSEKATEQSSRKLGQICHSLVEGKNLEVLGPVPAPLAKIKGKHRWQILLKAPKRATLQNFIRNLFNTLDQKQIDQGVNLTVDVDPYNML